MMKSLQATQCYFFLGYLIAFQETCHTAPRHNTFIKLTLVTLYSCSVPTNTDNMFVRAHSTFQKDIAEA